MIWNRTWVHALTIVFSISVTSESLAVDHSGNTLEDTALEAGWNLHAFSDSRRYWGCAVIKSFDQGDLVIGVKADPNPNFD